MSDSFAPHDPEAAERAVAVLKVLSHAGRLRILCHLIDRAMTVGDLAAALGEAQSGVSQQLMRLRAEGIVRPRRNGKTVTYHMARTDIAPVIATLRTTLCQHPPPA